MTKLKSGAGRSRTRRWAARSATPRRGGGKPQPKSFPVVGIGASAGGYEAFTKFLEALPVNTGMAFVLVQHLDPTHESKLSELLARATRLPVIEVTRGGPVRPNHVYVIPPNKNLIIVRGRLKLTPRQTGEIPPMPVDSFFRSLAEDQKQNAIGIIFSGNGSDGTLGLEAIKGADGITFAQEPRTARFTGMPDSAIGSGCVDFVLPPERMAGELIGVLHHLQNGSGADPEAAAAKEPDALAKIYSLLRSASGVDFSAYKQSTLKRRIQRRMVVHQIGSLEKYTQYLKTHPAEVQALFDDALITVTRFFRDPKSLQVLVKKVFPALIRNRRHGQPIRIWVPGCSSGEEVYSLAMALVEFLGHRAKDFPLQIFGTDISEAAIAKARAGIYRANIALDVSPARLRRFFTRADDSFRVNKTIRELCVFARQNLGSDPPFSRMDLISCQNLLIYLGPELQKRCVSVFHYALQPNGFLLLGSAESVAGLSDLFTQVDRRQRLFVKTTPLAQAPVTFTPRFSAEDAAGVPAHESIPPEPLVPNIEKAADRVLLHHYTPGGVVIDSRMQVLQFRGYTAAYLEHSPGAASLNLLKMVRSELAMPLRSAIAKALKHPGPVRKQVALTKARDQKRQLKLEIVPFKVPPAKDPFLLVLFEEGQRLDLPEAKPPRPGKRAGVRSATDAEILRLRHELEAARESFQAVNEEQEATNEELKSANEEIQSSNEELQSTNEELETAKEELQSANEELATVNDELQNANLEANRVNNDLLNLLASIQIPMVMVDNNLTIRRFTPSAQRFFNFIATDVGRNLNDIKANFDVPDLNKMILEVIETLHLKEREVRDHSGNWYSLRIRPYRTKENKIDGAVLALLDINELKRAVGHMSEVLWEPFLALDADLRVIKANEAFYQNFRTTRAETEGRYIHELGDGQWNIPRLHTLLRQVLPNETSVKDFQVQHDFPNLGPRTMLLNARQLDASESGKEIILAGDPGRDEMKGDFP